ncbi:hypothetical protein GALMADRAFT_52101 [Galerina marginata CBS 339.88]|uniref:Uncharacterized protein n=1 Tax=Galerina marginata (strain CBS 339.88) TaxID=685588 RepID=A0A067TQ08_GALM3|nr:hypothetical protein GALMADRAFT_52101 [Galerina marginata CBS 339.88]
MDELVHHCLRELAFDGDLGSDVSRLKDFIVDFYAHSDISHAQNTDDAFCAFVWSLVVQQPTVLVGLIDQGIASEVWIAPQVSAKRKAVARGDDHIGSRPPKLDPIHEPKTTPLQDLHGIYGDRLRLAVEPDTIFAAITGSHIRSSKMSPMVYSAFQIITRGRDLGVTVVDLGKLSGYDQKTCFYLVRQLKELDLVVKVRRGGVGTHFCIHKYFFERSSSWKAIRDEETQAETLQVKKQSCEIGSGEEDDLEDSKVLEFTPIDARHLSSLPLISARVIRLLKASKNRIHTSNNMLITLGFSNPTKTDRRFFQSRIREMIQQRLIEKVIVPSNKKKSLSKNVKCFRLVKQESSTPEDSGFVLSDPDEDADDLALGLLLLAHNGVKFNTTIHKQIIDHLEDSETSGMTLSELSVSLCQFDKRTIELLLARADKYHPPSHLSDLRIASLMETSGRERRHRYFTVANYCSLVAREELDKSSAGYADVDFNDVGGFLPLAAESFYETRSELKLYSDVFKDNDKTRVPKPRKRPLKNPILPDGKVKRGRPRKNTTQVGRDSNLLASQNAKRKRKDVQESSQFSPEEPPKKKTRTTNKQSEEPNSDGVPPPCAGHEHLLMRNDLVQGTDSGSQIASTNTLQLTLSTHANSASQCDFPRQTLSETDINVKVADISGADGHTLIPLRDDSRQPSRVSLVNNPLVLWTNFWTYTHAENVAIDSTSQLHETPEQPSSRTQPEMLTHPTTSTTSTVTSKINVSQLRRENELLRLVENAGGIVNIQTKEFFQAHMKLLELLTQAGEPTSAPVGTKTDKRTVTTTFNNLENKGRIKQIRTSVTTLTGVLRPICIIYLPDIEQSKINAFLADIATVSQPATSPLNSFLKIDMKMDYAADSSSSSRGVLPLQLLQMEQPGANEKERWSKNLIRARQLFAYDDPTIREVFLAERTTMAQLYGFIVGKALRCRELHLAGINAFETRTDSPHIVSHENRVVDLSFFCYDLPLQLYCSLVSPLAFNEELADFLAQEKGRETLVRYLPQSLQSALQPGKSRARSRILDMLEILRALNLVRPLRPSTSENPFMTCVRNGQHPTSFDLASLDGWTINTPMAAPIYWYFSVSASLHLYAQSETHPPFWKIVDVKTSSASLVYWDELREASASTNLPFNTDITVSNQHQASPASIGVARSLRRVVSWRSGYFLTWHQLQYLKQFIDSSSMSTPLQISDERERQSQLQRISWVVSAPQKTIEDHFSLSREKLLKNLVRTKDKARRTQIRADQAKLSLARKAEEARIQREQEWGKLLMKTHTEALAGSAAVRMERVRAQFILAGSIKDLSRWEKEIQAALREADLASSKALKIAAKRPAPSKQIPLEPLVVINIAPSEEVFIQRQGSLPENAPTNVKRKRKKDTSPGPTDFNMQKKPNRRHRFHWNQEFDELARDASAIIRARCRDLPRLDWAAFEQVFPSVPRNTVRQRLTHIRETPGNEAYLRRLEDSWYEIWVKYRGTPHLPDDDFRSASNFDLVKHVEFLRTHIDKNAIRVGFAHAKEITNIEIPWDIENLHRSFDVVQAEKTAPEWDFMWNALIEEGREKKLKKVVISRCAEEFPLHPAAETDEIILSEGALKLKMVMSTPPERYDAEEASSLLRSRGEGSIDVATKNLLSRGVLSKSQRDPQKQKPGRQLKISEGNQNALGGSISRDTFQDAVSLLEEIDINDASWHNWPLTATDGDCAALIELVSDGKVDFNIDTSLPQAARPALDWNSKKAGEVVSSRVHQELTSG